MEWVIDLFNKLLEFLYRLLLTLVDMLKDVFIWLIEAVLGAVGLLIEQCLALIKPIPISDYLSAIPPEPAWMLSAKKIVRHLLYVEPQVHTTALPCLCHLQAG
ncbi:hypothetical protein, partial [Vibrio vulnificus]|uniref:hypothetical protein n=1 Tax=Vibrio vulnificus TaxID=672 RepID=UPI00068BC882